MVGKNNVLQRQRRQRRISQALLKEFDDAIESELQTLRFENGFDDASEATTPTFVFVREVKWLLGEYLDDREGTLIMGKILQMRSPDADDAWEATFPEYSDPAAEFGKAWNLVKFPVGMLDRAAALAKARPFPIVSGISKKSVSYTHLTLPTKRIV